MLTRTLQRLAIVLAALGGLSNAAIGAGPATQTTDYAVIVHVDQATDDLSSASLKGIFKAEQQFWADKHKTRVSLLLPKAGTESMDAALAAIYRMTDKELKKYWVEQIYQNKITTRPKEFPNSKILIRIVAKDKGAISIVPAADVDDDSTIKTLTIDGKRPGDKGYALSIDQAKTTAIAMARLQDASAPIANDDTDARFEELENQLLDIQIEMMGGGSDGSAFDGGPLFSMKGFGHVGFSSTSADAGPDGNTFALGGLDLFINSQLSENLSFLNETVFEPTATGEYVLDVERVILKYQVSDALNIQAGRFHTTLGYWNDTFHHGEWLQTSIGRPTILNFEDEGGLLPVHLVGLVFKGRQAFGDSPLDWTVEIGNGRGATADPPQITTDANGSKALNLAVRFAPSGIDGLKVGGGVYLDKIPMGASPEELDETIANAHIVYEAEGWQLIAEYFDIQHDGATINTSSNGYYTQVARKMDDWTPYVRYDISDVDNDPYFSHANDTETIAIGVRWDYSAWSAIKLQYNDKTVSPTSAPDEDESSIQLQVSFAF